MKRGYKQITGARTLKRNYKKRPRRVQGLVPYYQGFTPRQFSRGEWKYLDTTIAAGPLTNAGTFTLLDGLLPGSGASQRIGMKVAIRSVEIRTRITTSAAAQTAQVGRTILLLDHQTNGAAPAALTDFLTPGTFLGCRNLAARKRFKFCWDKTYSTGGFASNADPMIIYRHAYLKFRRPIIVEYNTGVAGTVADIVSNALYFIQLGDQAAAGTNATIQTTVRVRYTDM